MRNPYEEGFNGSSYGFRPRYSQNNALDEVYVVLMQNKISCVRHTYLCGKAFRVGETLNIVKFWPLYLSLMFALMRGYLATITMSGYICYGLTESLVSEKVRGKKACAFLWK